jgi:dienelactone hydrolase
LIQQNGEKAMNSIDFNDLLIIRKGSEQLTMGAGASELCRISSLSEWEQKASALREIYKMTLGTQPYGIVDPAMELVEEINEGKYLKRKIAYNTGPNERITAYVLIPEPRTPQCPAVICLHQTTPSGKEQVIGNGSSPNCRDFACALHLVKLGFITFAYDLLSAGERCFPGLKAFDTSPFYERYPQWSMRGKDIYDVSRAVDVLLSMPEVKPDRIGCIGHSQGGGLTIHAMAVETRISAGVSNCGVWPMRMSKNPYNEARTSWWTGRPLLRPFCLTGKEFPVQVHELMALSAPRPLMNISALNDYQYSLKEKEFTAQGFINMAQCVKNVFSFYGKDSSFINLTHLNGHSFMREQRNMAYRFLHKYLEGSKNSYR